MCEVGEILPNHVVHHVDGNSFNNEVSNFECVSKNNHTSNHMSTKERRDQSRFIMLNSAHPAAKEWHKSEIGKEWHKTHIAESIYGDERKRICMECNKEYSTNIRMETKFCCKKHQWKYQARIQRENKTKEFKCPTCGSKIFGRQYCSTKCYYERSL